MELLYFSLQQVYVCDAEFLPQFPKAVNHAFHDLGVNVQTAIDVVQVGGGLV